MAGTAAERAFLGRSRRGRAHQRREKAQKLIDHRTWVANDCWKQAEALVGQNHGRIAVVAMELLARGRPTGREVDRLVRAV